MLLTLLLLPCQIGSLPVTEQSFLYQPSFCMDHELRTPVIPYFPQPGDIYLSTDKWWIAKFGHKLALSGAPNHSGLVVALPDGHLALLEGGPFHSWDGAGLLDLIPAITYYGSQERIYIRQRAVPLAEEQSRRLTAFALAVQGRPFAAGRMMAMATPFALKGPLRTRLFGRPRSAHFNPDDPEPGLKRNYFCSELVVEALVAAGVQDPNTSRPTSTFPRELFFGTSTNPWLKRHLDLSAWYPPARWTACPGAEPPVKPRPWLDGDTTR